MQVKDIMTKIVLTVPPECKVAFAAQIMRDNRIGLLPVGDRDKVEGTITDRDITVRVTAAGLDAKKTDVREVMSPQSYYCFEDQDVEDACFMMEEKHVRRLMVFDRTHTLAGVVSLDDVAVKTRKDRLTGYTLAKVGKTERKTWIGRNSAATR